VTTIPTAERNRRQALRFLELATHYRVDECLALMTVDVTWTVLGHPEMLQVAGTWDRTGAIRLLKGFRKLVPEPMQTTVRGTTAEANRVAVETAVVGKLADGSIYTNNYHFLFEFRDGLIASLREYMDTLHVFDVVQKRRCPPAEAVTGNRDA
jgi:ketosteroid isomerase-like protein